jgi:hypothetical protein
MFCQSVVRRFKPTVLGAALWVGVGDTVGAMLAEADGCWCPVDDELEAHADTQATTTTETNHRDEGSTMR